MKTVSSQIIYLNDRPKEVEAGGVLAGLIQEMGLGEKKGIAVAVNGEVVPRSEWPARGLGEGDRVLVIQATQGG